MLMGDFSTIWALQAELDRIREYRERLEQLQTEGPEGIRREIQRLEQREAEVLNEIAAESELLNEIYG